MSRDKWSSPRSGVAVSWLVIWLMMASHAAAQGTRESQRGDVGAPPATVTRERAIALPSTICDGPTDVCAFFERYLAAFNARDFDGFRGTFADDITFFVDRPFPPERLEGRAAVEALFRPGFVYLHPPVGAAVPKLPPPLVPVDLRVQVFGDAAVISFLVRTPGEVARRTLVIRRGADGWRVVHIHGSSVDLPGK